MLPPQTWKTDRERFFSRLNSVLQKKYPDADVDEITPNCNEQVVLWLDFLNHTWPEVPDPLDPEVAFENAVSQIVAMRGLKPSASKPAGREEWLTVTAAAEKLVILSESRKLDGKDSLSLEDALVYVSRWCSSGEVRSTGKRTNRRVDAASLNTRIDLYLADPVAKARARAAKPTAKTKVRTANHGRVSSLAATLNTPKTRQE